MPRLPWAMLKQPGPPRLQEFQFGFVPRHIVQDLKDLGNWRVRSAALVSLQQSVATLTPKSALALAPLLPQFMDFLIRVSNDTNFKVTIATLGIVSMAVEKLGKELQPMLRCAPGPALAFLLTFFFSGCSERTGMYTFSQMFRRVGDMSTSLSVCMYVNAERMCGITCDRRVASAITARVNNPLNSEGERCVNNLLRHRQSGHFGTRSR